MNEPIKSFPEEKEGLHKRNRHNTRYDFDALIKTSPGLAPFVKENKFGIATVNFSDPDAVIALNTALLKHFYGISNWQIPVGYLCPPVPGRADYVHYAADLLAASQKGLIPEGSNISVLDIGTGANCIYPIIGVAEYGWHFCGTEIDDIAIKSASNIVASNDTLQGLVEIRRQTDANKIFDGVVKPDEYFDLALCNPPFHSTLQEAQAGTDRKWKNLGQKQNTDVKNFGGNTMELCYPGGEIAFIRNMIKQSVSVKKNIGWFTSLVSKKTNLPAIQKALAATEAREVKIIEMAQGQKNSRFIAWKF